MEGCAEVGRDKLVCNNPYTILLIKFLHNGRQCRILYGIKVIGGGYHESARIAYAGRIKSE